MHGPCQDMLYWRMALVYALKCPVTNSIRYIGYTSGTAIARYKQHISQAAAINVFNWVESLKQNGLLPELEVIYSGLSNADAQVLEQELINSHENLLNYSYSSLRKRNLTKVDPLDPSINMLDWWRKKRQADGLLC